MDINLEGLGVIKEFSYKNRKLFATLVLEGLPDSPISVEAADLEIAPDGSTVSVKSLKSNMPFVHNALNRFVKGPFNVPVSARPHVINAKCLLGL